MTTSHMPLTAAGVRCLRLACCVTAFLVAAMARGETVYVVSKSTNKLLEFDSGAPGTVTTLASGLYSPSALAMGADGNLYIAEWGDGDTIDPRISRFDPKTNSLTVVTTLDWETQYKPSSLAFRPALQGGEMLVGRLGAGPILKVSGWAGNAATVADYTTGLALDGGLGLAVAADGTLYVSDSAYAYNPVVGYPVASGPIVSFGSDGAFVGTVAADGSGTGGLSGPTGLVLAGDTLYSASVMNGKIFATNLLIPQTSPYGEVGYPFEVGPLARLSDGTLLAGSVSGVSSSIYAFAPGGALAGALYNANFGQVGGIVAVTAVPEIGDGSFAAYGVALFAGLLELGRLRRARA